ncbi:MAG TPA: hypothetical protein VG297_24995 [Bryobacteraceae bacterium]|jgi:hypothetical protein|nr:hypothetical protein [Bryobacteraceae bacterium]
MDLTHIHLLLNHFPTIGYIIGGGLFALALITKSSDLKRASLVVLLGIALIALPTYMSGNGAQDAIKSLPGISKSLIEEHEGAALVGIAFMEFTGAFAWLGLWQFRRLARIPDWNLAVILVLTVVSLGLMIRASNLGGEIRHAEIRATTSGTSETTATADTESTGLARTVGSFVTDTKWVWPTCETLHFIGLTLLLGVVLIVDLRVLGLMKGVSFASLHRLLPWAAFGFGVNVITGMLFFVGIPKQYTGNVSFYVKIALVMLAGLNALYFTVLEEPWALGPGEDAPLTAKFAAASAMVLWIGVLYCGSMLPFLGNAF